MKSSKSEMTSVSHLPTNLSDGTPRFTDTSGKDVEDFE